MLVTVRVRGKGTHMVDEEGWRGDDPEFVGRLMEFYPPRNYNVPRYGEPPPLSAARQVVAELGGEILDVEGENDWVGDNRVRQ
jgi:hypothetical protein